MRGYGKSVCSVVSRAIRQEELSVPDFSDHFSDAWLSHRVSGSAVGVLEVLRNDPPSSINGRIVTEPAKKIFVLLNRTL